MNNFLRISAILIFISISHVDHVQSQTIPSAQLDSVSFYDLSLTDLMNMEIAVASQKPLSIRESPGIVTLITEDEIKNSGALDLMDVLSMVPGIQFGSDVQGVVGIGVRGNWAHEGKALMLWDGHPLNENLYSTMQFGNHFPVDRIKRIEIIRGPGSAIYGGYAEYAVINIISKNDKEYNGLDAAISYGQMKNSFSHRNITVSAGRSHGDFSCSASLFTGEGIRSDRNYYDNSGSSFNMAGNSELNPMLGEFNLGWKNFSLSALVDDYRMTSRDGYDHTTQIAYPNVFKSYSVLSKYKFEFKNKFQVTPSFSFRREKPWNYTETANDGDDYPTYDVIAERMTFNITASKDLNDKINLLFGGETYSDKAKDNHDAEYFTNGKAEIHYVNHAAFAQSMFRTRLANFTAGARYHYNSNYPSSFVPRFAVTKTFSKTHFKFLYSKAFRTPSIENINLGMGEIKPEKTTTVELETGWNVNAFWQLSANVFDINTSDPIIYFYDGTDSYHNGTDNGTRGFEISGIFRNSYLHVLTSYSFYTTEGKETEDEYLAAQGKNYVLAFSNHKINVTVNYDLNSHTSICYNHTWLSERQAFAGTDENGNNLYWTYMPCHQGNIACRIKNIFTRGMTAEIGINNIWDTKILYLTPYFSNHGALPGMSREVHLSLLYNFNFANH
jgi:outer membrane cobalamin receptor